MSPNPYRHECEYFTEGCVKCHLGVAWFEGHDYRNQEVADLTAKLDEAGDCKARAVAIDEQNQRLRKFIFELCPHETYLATSMGWIRDQIARASDCEALRAELREARLEVADDIFRVLVAGEDKKCAEVVSWLMRYIDDIAAMKGAK